MMVVVVIVVVVVLMVVVSGCRYGCSDWHCGSTVERYPKPENVLLVAYSCCCRWRWQY